MTGLVTLKLDFHLYTSSEKALEVNTDQESAPLACANKSKADPPPPNT